MKNPDVAQALMITDLLCFQPGIIMMITLLVMLCIKGCLKASSVKWMTLSSAGLGLVGSMICPIYWACKHQSAGGSQWGTAGYSIRVLVEFTLGNAAWFITVGIYVMQLVLWCN